MEGEIINFIRVWSIAIASTCYSYSLSRIFHISKGISRLIFILPVIYLFILLPFSLSSLHLGGPTTFYLVWLGTFKLILYSFDLGPLSTHPNKSLLHFVPIALLPIKVKDEPRSSNAQHKGYPCQDYKINGGADCQTNQELQGRTTTTTTRVSGRFVSCVKLLTFALAVKIYEYREQLPSSVMLASFGYQLYLGTELTLTIGASLVRAILGLDLDPPFNKPYLATSLQDFWGRRWNLVVSNILRVSIYNPIRRVATPLVGRRWAMAGARLAAFKISGLMHEVIFFYLTHVRPTWEVTCFFILHGVRNAAEVAAKEAIGGRFRLLRVVSGLLTIGFVGCTGVWLLLPQIIRNGVDVKVINEYPIMIDFVKQNVLHLASH